MSGSCFAQCSVGQTLQHEIRRTVTDIDNMLFCSLIHDCAAIHIGHAFAATTAFGEPLIDSIFTLGRAIGLSVQDTTMDTTIANPGIEDTGFPNPVFAGETIRAEGLDRDCRRARRGGFAERIAIHPDQIAIIDRCFAPSVGEIARTRRIIDAFATKPDAGAVGIDGWLHDIPQPKAARKTLASA